MSRKRVNNEYAQIEAGDMSADIDTQSDRITDVEYMDRAFYSVSWAGVSPVGVINIQFSNDKTNWKSLDFGQAINVSGNSGNHEIFINQITFKYLKTIYTATSGTGTLVSKIKTATEGA